MQSYRMAKYNLNHPFYQYRNLLIIFIFSLLLIGVYRTAMVAKWQSLDHAIYLYVCDKLNIYSHF